MMMLVLSWSGALEGEVELDEAGTILHLGGTLIPVKVSWTEVLAREQSAMGWCMPEQRPGGNTKVRVNERGVGGT